MTIGETLAEFDGADSMPFDEHNVSAALIKIIPENKDEISDELRYELMAFDFQEDYVSIDTGWGTYFGPLGIWTQEDGTIVESPSISLVTQQTLDYWLMRSGEVVNPVLAARYLGLVWDFTERVTNTKPRYEIGIKYLNALLDVAKGKYHKHHTVAFTKLERALELAILFSNEKMIQECKSVVLMYEKEVAIDTSPGLWGYSFDLLLLNKKVSLTTEETAAIITQLEGILNRTTNTEGDAKVDPWAGEQAATRLASYYAKNKSPKDVRRVMLALGKAFNHAIVESSPMQAQSQMEMLYRLYKKFGLPESEEILIKIREIGPAAANEMQVVSSSMQISNKEMEDFLNSITSGTVQQVLHNFILQFLPFKEKAKEQLFQHASQDGFLYTVSTKLYDSKGRVVATIGSLDSDLEGHLVREISQDITISSYFLRAALQRIHEKSILGKDEILSYISSIPLIPEDHTEIIARAVDAYFLSDYMTFIHFAVPQIEEAMRNLLEMCGGTALKPQRGGGYHLRTFDDLLRDELLINKLGPDLTHYFRVLFTDPRGWNLRNLTCHGMVSAKYFSESTADRLLHALLCVGLVRRKDENAS